MHMREDPLVYACASQADATNQAMAHGQRLGAQLVPTSGTPSMLPVIGRAAVLLVKKDFATAAVGKILVYEGSTSPAGPLMLLCHRAQRRDRRGFIMRGDANAAAETWQRVDLASYRGTVVAIFNYPPGD